jgi:hypothetical protein
LYSDDWNKLFEENTDYSNIRWIMPLINWNKDDVWNFIRTLTLPYCTLYDQGYVLLYSNCRELFSFALILMNLKKVILPGISLVKHKNDNGFI